MGATADESARGAEDEFGAGVSASGNPYDGGGSADRADGGSNGTGENGLNVECESDWKSGWSARNSGDGWRTDSDLKRGEDTESLDPPLLELDLEDEDRHRRSLPLRSSTRRI